MTETQPITPQQTDTRWFVLHTKSRQEKAVADYLAKREVEHFLPLMEQVRYYGKRKARVELPMFPGYVFLHGTVEQAYDMDRTRRLAQIIPVTDQSQIDWELSNIRLAMERDLPVESYPYLKQGVRVEVRSGPMRGLQGIVADRTRRDRLILQVDMLGQAVSVEVDGSLLDVLD
ncbi:UpxY family transcription antiterminator [Phycisphaerales bacterium AB-hyl4]|uniref:UpxY family transcription antiterminator n=1 Tax=Natronomicrosphaera hydrolytica TaxID=3242702 RepID=A0ABV4U3N9_9BACT